MANDESEDFTVLAVEESEGTVLTAGEVDSTTLFTVTDPEWTIYVRLLGTARMQASGPSWKLLAGLTVASYQLTLTATGTGDPVECVSSGSVPNNGNEVRGIGLTQEVWVDGPGVDAGAPVDFSCAVSLADGAFEPYRDAVPIVGELVLEDWVLEVRQLEVPPFAGENDVALFGPPVRA